MTTIATVHELASAAQRGDFVLDVRNADEYAAGHVTGSRLIPLPVLPVRLSELDRHHPIYVMCESGARAYQACQFLDRHDFEAVHVAGGMNAWRAAGLPVELGRDDITGGN
ncbi:MAG: rhodanese-like domain-containing protein [Candidatus Nanopelagicales bacterium]